ncbi:MAG TPA: polyprenyl synthetase family protein [Candidatus Coproplasma stercoravium]|nr:polyprenyl synthetase family protein [Candidatus Coproplasma stercoravium]
MYSFKEKYGEYLSAFEVRLKRFYEELTCRPQILDDSLKYSLKSGGKRVRPVLMLAAADLVGAQNCGVEDYALALELIHTYSLIHDDLPEMDNDDFRRGRPSNHKMFGAGNAVLAGDGLLNTAYYILFERCADGKLFADAAKFMCGCAGVTGMIAGQSADLYCAEKGIKDGDMLDFIVANKTGKLISAAVAVPAILAGGKNFLELRQFGEDLGRLFQLVDDILDEEGNFEHLGKTSGKDKEENKLTYVTFYGAEQCRVYADIMFDRCLKMLEGIDGDTRFFKDVVSFVRYREG